VPELDASNSTNAGRAFTLRFDGDLRAVGRRCGWSRSAHFRKLGLSTSSARAACVLRHSANRRCTCSTSSR
jgi:hypothetical protein